MSISEIITAFRSMSKDEKLKLKLALDKEFKADIDEVVSKKRYRKAGSLKGSLKHISEDFDEPIEDMKEYMY